MTDREIYFLHCCWQGDLNEVERLLDEGVNINIQDDDGFTPLIIAIVNKDIDLVELLIEKGADVSIKDNDGKDVFDYLKEEYDASSPREYCLREQIRKILKRGVKNVNRENL
jgi:hypothetical protein